MCIDPICHRLCSDSVPGESPCDVIVTHTVREEDAKFDAFVLCSIAVSKSHRGTVDAKRGFRIAFRTA